jgi:branched-chain amino acid transport system substrate-binding protein
MRVLRSIRLIFILIALGAMLMGFRLTAQAQDEIRIGAVQATIGPFSKAFIEINAGLKDIINITNSEGGINGKKIKYIMTPTDYDVEESKQAFEAIMKEHSPHAMFGNSTGLGLALADKITDVFKVLYCSPSYSAQFADKARYPTMFLPGPTYGEQMALLLQYIAERTPNAKVAFFYSDTAFGRDPIKFAKIMCRRLRLRVVDEEVVKLGTLNVSSEVAKMHQADPDYVIFQGFIMDPVPTVIAKAREAGMTCKFMGAFWGATKEVLDRLGPLSRGYMVVNPFSYWTTTDAPMIQKIRSYNQANHPEVTYRPNYYMHGFATGLIYIDVLKRADSAGELNSEGITKALHNTENLDTGGLTATLTIRNNRFPVARIWEANPDTLEYEPVSEWLKLKRD